MTLGDFRRSLPPLTAAPQAPPEGAALPAGYGREKLVAVPRDARRVYLYWELAPAKLERIQRTAASAQPEIHLASALTRRPIRAAPCGLAAGAAWLDAPPGETLYAELGLADFGRPFTVLLRSESFRMPWGEALRERSRPGLELPDSLRRFSPPEGGTQAGPRS